MLLSEPLASLIKKLSPQSTDVRLFLSNNLIQRIKGKK